MSSNYYALDVENPLAIDQRESQGPDELYRRAFQYFKTIFDTIPEADVSKTSLFSYDLPEEIRSERRMMGAVITGALVAMLDHETHTGIQVTPELHTKLDEIIIQQASITGAALLTSDLVLSRMSEWERTDYRKYKQWFKSLDKAARIHQQRTTAPLDDPLLKIVKPLAVEQLRPVVARMQERFARQRLTPKEEEIVEAFREETRNPDVAFLNHEHNRELWLRFYRRDPVAHLYLSPERLFDAFTAFVKMHEPEYVRKKISSLNR